MLGCGRYYKWWKPRWSRILELIPEGKRGDWSSTNTMEKEGRSIGSIINPEGTRNCFVGFPADEEAGLLTMGRGRSKELWCNGPIIWEEMNSLLYWKKII